MAGRKAQDKNVLEFGKASMYVIAENELQKEKLIRHSKPATDSELFSGRNLTFSRTKAKDFSWKEIAGNTSKHSNQIRVLDLNGSVRIDVDMKRYINIEKARFAGAKKQNDSLNQPSACLNPPGVNDLKQTTNEHKRASCLCSIFIDGYKKSIEDKFTMKTSSRENDYNQEDKCFLEKKTLPRSCCSDSLLCNGNSTNLNSVEQDDTASSKNLRSLVTDTENAENSGKCYLKRIFYSKGNNYSKSTNLRYLPPIRNKTGDQTAVMASVSKGGSNSLSTEPNASKRSQGNNQLLLPLNVSILKNKEKQRHHFKSIVELPTVMDKRTGQVHLALDAIAYGQSDYNKWSRRQKRIKPGNAKISFPLITENSR